MMYSNMVPPQDNNTLFPLIFVSGLPKANQWSSGTCLFAIAIKLASLASLASKL